MNQSPILKALSSIRKSGARTLLMGGQACVFYGAAEFSRDLDLLILLEPGNLERFQHALNELQAETIAVPGFEARFLEKGHAVHFRCRREDVSGLRIDLMSSIRGVAGFEDLWGRRTTIDVDGQPVDLFAIEDLVQAKKTQRNKDWPMIRRLVETDYFSGRGNHVEFWLRELRTPELLTSVALENPNLAARIALERPAVAAALTGDVSGTEAKLEQEERRERELDRIYWEPLKREMEQFRRSRRDKDPAAPI